MVVLFFMVNIWQYLASSQRFFSLKLKISMCELICFYKKAMYSENLGMFFCSKFKN